MKKQRFQVSIGMPVYNAEQFLEESLKSILTQSFADFEVVISDNASTDRTDEICRDFAGSVKRIHYSRNETNVGASKNYNRVFELSQGEYFKWAAADDICAPELLEKCRQALEDHPDAVLSYPKTKIIDAAGELVEDYHDGLDLRDARECDRFIQLVNSIRECNAVFGLVRSEVLRRTALIANHINSDVNLLAELSLYGKFCEIPEYLFYRRNHPQASSWDKSIDKQLEFFDPALLGKAVFKKWKMMLAYFAAVKRAPLVANDKLDLYTYLCRKIVWSRQAYAAELINGVRYRFLSQRHKLSLSR